MLKYIFLFAFWINTPSIRALLLTDTIDRPIDRFHIKTSSSTALTHRHDSRIVLYFSLVPLARPLRRSKTSSCHVCHDGPEKDPAIFPLMTQRVRDADIHPCALSENTLTLRRKTGFLYWRKFLSNQDKNEAKIIGLRTVEIRSRRLIWYFPNRSVSILPRNEEMNIWVTKTIDTYHRIVIVLARHTCLLNDQLGSIGFLMKSQCYMRIVISWPRFETPQHLKTLVRCHLEKTSSDVVTEDGEKASLFTIIGRYTVVCERFDALEITECAKEVRSRTLESILNFHFLQFQHPRLLLAGR